MEWLSEMVGFNHITNGINAEELMEQHKVAAQSSFGTRTSTKRASFQCSDSGNKENDSPNANVTHKVRSTFITSDNECRKYKLLHTLLSYGIQTKVRVFGSKEC